MVTPMPISASTSGLTSADAALGRPPAQARTRRKLSPPSVSAVIRSATLVRTMTP
jgi:hypothetical protein